MVPVVHKPLYAARAALLGAWAAFTRAAWWTPLFLSRVETKAPGLRLVGSGMPLVIGPVRLLFGRDVEMVTAVTIAGRTATPVAPVLELGDRASVGWQVTISVGTRIAIGRNARVGNRSFLAGYPGHPYDPDLRAAGAPDTDDQVGDIVLEDDVWLGTGVTVLPGVTIGRGTVVGAGSVVTRDLPRMVLAAGVPARVIRAIDAPKDRGEPA
jgi:acetyltransferase-like isoleucine patch superfamily enzyme